MHDIDSELTWRVRCAIRDAAPVGSPNRLEGRLKPLHGSDVQDWIISLRPGYWADPADVLNDMCRRGMLRRLTFMPREHQEQARRASSVAGSVQDDPLCYWYEALPGPPCPWYRALDSA